jgi:hypothetical protein
MALQGQISRRQVDVYPVHDIQSSKARSNPRISGMCVALAIDTRLFSFGHRDRSCVLKGATVYRLRILLPEGLEGLDCGSSCSFRSHCCGSLG